MDIRLSFKITRADGEEETQEISTPTSPDPNLPIERQQLMVMQQMFNQYAQVGMLRQPKKDTFILLCPSQIAFVECTLPSLILANATEMPKGGLITE